jgi:hypothetical protein
MQEDQSAIQQFQQRRLEEIQRTKERRAQQQEELRQHELQVCICLSLTCLADAVSSKRSSPTQSPSSAANRALERTGMMCRMSSETLM